MALQQKNAYKSTRGFGSPLPSTGPNRTHAHPGWDWYRGYSDPKRKGQTEAALKQPNIWCIVGPTRGSGNTTYCSTTGAPRGAGRRLRQMIRSLALIKEALCRKMHRHRRTRHAIGNASKGTIYKRGSLCPIYAARSTVRVALATPRVRVRDGVPLVWATLARTRLTLEAAPCKPPTSCVCSRRARTCY